MTARNPRLLFVSPGLIPGGLHSILRGRCRELERRGIDSWITVHPHLVWGTLSEEVTRRMTICDTEEEITAGIKQFDPDWIVSIDPKLPVFDPRNANGREIPIVLEVQSSYPQHMGPLRDRERLKVVSKVIAASPTQLDFVRDLLPFPIPMAVVPNVVAEEFFAEIDDLDRPSRPCLTWVGRVYDDLKNLPDFIEIARQVRQHQDVQVIIVGSGPPHDRHQTELSVALERAGLTEHTTWLREIEHQRMPRVLQETAASGGCTIVTTQSEGLSQSTLEALASGCPVVASNVRGVRDVIEPEHNARLFLSGDIDRAVELVVELLNDPVLHQKFARNARDAARHFTNAVSVDALIAALPGSEALVQSASTGHSADQLPWSTSVSPTMTVAQRLEAQRADIRALRIQLASVGERFEMLSSEVNQLRHENWELDGKVTWQQDTIAWKDRELAGRDQSIAWLQEEVAARDRSLAWQTDTIAARDTAIAWLQDELAARDRRIAELEAVAQAGATCTP